MDTNRRISLFSMMIVLLLITGCTVLDILPTSTPTVEPTKTKPAFEELESCPPMDAEMRAEMDRIEDEVTTLRGLQANAPVERTLLTNSQLRQRVSDDFLAEYSEDEVRDDVIVLSLLGLLPQDFDLWTFYVDLLTEQIAGFYDDSTEEMAVICGSGFGGLERMTYSHEYLHVLQDQTYDLEEGLGYSEELCELDSERCAGLQALIEGDATLLEEQWMTTYATQEDIMDAMEYISNLDTPVYDSAPRFLRQDLLFPYQAGLTFVKTIFRDGGWAAVDAVYQNPPTSTEQILHPEKYPLDNPVKLIVPEATAALGSDWTLIDENALGEWYTQLVLNEFISKSDAAPAADGWGGDVYHVYHNDSSGEGLLLLVTQWDSMVDVHEFSSAFIAYIEARFGERTDSSTYVTMWDLEDTYIYFERNSNQTLWILAPDGETAAALQEVVSLPVELE
jgi:hypothetical protein